MMQHRVQLLQPMQYTAEQRQQAVELAQAVGPAKAGRELGINPNTVRSWVTRAGETTGAHRVATRAATEAKVLTLAERQATLAAGLLDDIDKLRVELFAPCVEKRAMVVSMGAERGSRIEVAEVELSRPSPADQLRLMRAITEAAAKVQLLSGEATERIESTVVTREQRLREARERADLRLVSGE